MANVVSRNVVAGEITHCTDYRKNCSRKSVSRNALVSQNRPRKKEEKACAQEINTSRSHRKIPGLVFSAVILAFHQRGVSVTAI